MWYGVGVLGEVGLVEALSIAVPEQSGYLLLQHCPDHLRQLLALRDWEKEGEKNDGRNVELERIYEKRKKVWKKCVKKQHFPKADLQHKIYYIWSIQQLWHCGSNDQPFLPPLKKRTRHWWSHGWSGSMASALLTDWSINRYFSERRQIVNYRHHEKKSSVVTLKWVCACQPFLK